MKGHPINIGKFQMSLQKNKQYTLKKKYCRARAIFRKHKMKMSYCHDNSPEHLAGNVTQFRVAVRGHTA